MGKITEALKKVTDERISRIQKKPEMQYVIRKIENTKVDEHIVSFHDSSSPVGEQYKILRTNIQSLKQAKGYSAFVITSSIHREGKTVTSINLAMSLAHDLNRKSVLLIDADLRKGRVSRYLGIEQGPGLSEVLKGKAGSESALVSPGVENFTIMPAGKVAKNPSELLASKDMERLILSLKSRFDYIFIDTPPVMPLADACIVGPLVDGVILVIQAGRTQREVIRHAESRLYQAHAKTLGYIMTNVEYHLPQYLYRYIHEYSDYAHYRQPEKEKELVAAN